MTIPKPGSTVAHVFQSYPVQAQKVLFALRRLIFQTAIELPEVGELTETLKWGQPAYLTQKSKSGSTIRIGWSTARPNDCAVYFICHTSLISNFRSMYNDTLRFEGNRAIILSIIEPLPHNALKTCIGMALTYHSSHSRL